MASRLVLLMLLGVAAVTLAHGSGCPQGWKHRNRRCFIRVRRREKWSDAEEECKEKGGHLASYHNQREINFALDLMNPPVPTWTGLNDRPEDRVEPSLGHTRKRREGHFVYTDGTDFDYKRWKSGEPSNSWGTENCVELLADGRFNDLHCERELHFICTKDV